MELTQQIVDTLKAAGIPAAHAWQAKRVPLVSEACAAVWLSHMEPGEQRVVVTVFGPTWLKETGWENAVEEALDALNGLYTSYSVGPCRFDREVQYLTGDIVLIFKDKSGTAAPASPYIPMRMGAQDLGHVTKFSVSLLPDGTSWTFHLEEFFPTGDVEEVLPQQPFSLTRGKDAFHSCKVSTWERRWTTEGLVQIKEGTSTGRTVVGG